MFYGTFIETGWCLYASLCRLFSTKPSSEPMLTYCQLDPKEDISMKFYLQFKSFQSRKFLWEYRHYVSASTEMIPWMCPANERRRYIVTSPLIGWTHSWSLLQCDNWPCYNMIQLSLLPGYPFPEAGLPVCTWPDRQADGQPAGRAVQKAIPTPQDRGGSGDQDSHLPTWWVSEKFGIYLGNSKMYLHFLSFLKVDMSQVIEILPHGIQGSVYPA